MPGDFNIAASTLYGGHYQGIKFGPQPWAANDPSDDFVTVTPGLTDTHAQLVFKSAIAFTGSTELFLEAMKTDVAIVKTETTCKSTQYPDFY
jgi:hypothetical protein